MNKLLIYGYLFLFLLMDTLPFPFPFTALMLIYVAIRRPVWFLQIVDVIYTR